MPQRKNHWITPEDMLRSRAWREGYESYLKGRPPAFGSHGSKSLAYEYGRHVAAYLRARDGTLPYVSTRRPVHAHHLPLLAAALAEVTRV